MKNKPKFSLGKNVGHGYFRKSKSAKNLVSLLAIGSALVLGGGVSADEAGCDVTAQATGSISSKVLTDDDFELIKDCQSVNFKEFNKDEVAKNADVFLLYRGKNVEVVPNSSTPSSPQTNVSVSNNSTSTVTNPTETKKATQPSKTSNVLPSTGDTKLDLLLSGLGLGVLGVAGYLVFKNKKTGKHLMAAVIVASGLAMANGDVLADVVKGCQDITFYQALKDYDGSQDYEYVGYVVFENETTENKDCEETPPTEPSTEEPKEEEKEPVTETSEEDVFGSVIVHYVDTEGNTIAEDVLDTDNEKVGTKITTTTTDKDGNVTSIDDYSPTGATYDTTDNKPETIDFDGKAYTFVAVQDGDVESAQVVEGVTHVTYIYDVVKTVKTFHIYEPYLIDRDNTQLIPGYDYNDGNHFNALVPVDLDPILWLEEDGTQPSRVEEFTDEYDALKAQYPPIDPAYATGVSYYSNLYHTRTVVDDEGNTYHYYTNDYVVGNSATGP